ncbi:hypothetical protein GOV13_05440 [Candidatus Pacearchaeota archaeon]|nr:hypothetical protein [Candidatus Pacearchaeota archaeon]
MERKNPPFGTNKGENKDEKFFKNRFVKNRFSNSSYAGKVMEIDPHDVYLIPSIFAEQLPGKNGKGSLTLRLETETPSKVNLQGHEGILPMTEKHFYEYIESVNKLRDDKLIVQRVYAPKTVF